MGETDAAEAYSAVITDPAQVTPARLTSILRRAGVLDGGVVDAVDTSAAPHLTVSYSPDAPASAPAYLYLKTQRRQNIAGGNGWPEVRAYHAWQDQHDSLPMLPRCYAAAYDEGTATSHVLLQDFSGTHTLPAWPVPTEEHRRGVTNCTAHFHARWWQHPGNQGFGALDPNLEVDCGDEARYLACVRRYQDAYPAFVDFVGDRLSAADRALYEAILGALPDLWSHHLARRFATGEHLTLIQGDSHWGQFACPNDPNRDMTLIFDLECLHVGLPAADLAYRLPFSWTPEQRHALEPDIIADYLHALQCYGVSGYDHDRFWEDYRLAFLFVALYPLKPFTARLRDRTITDWADGEVPAWFWRDLALIIGNLRDLGCANLLHPHS
jgi:hypothetical protein